MIYVIVFENKKSKKRNALDESVAKKYFIPRNE